MKTNQKMAGTAIEVIIHAAMKMVEPWNSGDIAGVKVYLEEIKDRTAIVEAEIKRQLYRRLGSIHDTENTK